MTYLPIRKFVQKTKQLDPKKLGRDIFTYIDISSIDRSTKQIVAPQILSIEEAPSRARKLILENDVLVSTVRPNLNNVTIVPRMYDGEIASTGFSVLRAKENVLNPIYLFYFTQTYKFISRLTRLSTGAGYPAVTDDIILDTKFPFLTITEQNSIATILEKADRQCQMRRFALELGDRYLQSVFLQMFGDPVDNTMDWKRRKLSKMISNLRGGSPLKPSDFIDKGFPVLHKGAIKPNGRIELDERKKTYTHEEFVKKYQNSVITSDYLAVTLRDLIPTGPTIGLMCRLNNGPYKKYILAQGAYGFTVDKSQILSDYLIGITNNARFRKYLRSIAVGSTQIHIRTPIYFDISIPVPPLTVQKRYSQLVMHFERIRSQQRESLRQAEQLFVDLLFSAFEGALFEK